MTKKIAHSLGEYLGEFLISRKIPSLSCNPTTNYIIQVTSKEADEYEKLNETWSSKVFKNSKLSDDERYSLAEKEWNDKIKYNYILKEKYLPHQLKCLVPYIDFSSEKINKHIKEGLIESLWDWDHCEWSLVPDDIIFENDNNLNLSFVTLKLELCAPSSFTGNEWIEIKTKQK